MSPKEYTTWWTNWTKNNPDDEPVMKKRMEWLAKAMSLMKHYEKIEECFVVE